MLPPVSPASSTSFSPQRRNPVADAVTMVSVPVAGKPAAQAVIVSGRTNTQVLLDHLRFARVTPALAEAIGQLLDVPRLAGETSADYVTRILEAIKVANPEVLDRIDQLLRQSAQGGTPRTAIEMMKNPAGADAAKLAAFLEKSVSSDKNLAAKSVVTSYRQNDGSEPSASHLRSRSDLVSQPATKLLPANDARGGERPTTQPAPAVTDGGNVARQSATVRQPASLLPFSGLLKTGLTQIGNILPRFASAPMPQVPGNAETTARQLTVTPTPQAQAAVERHAALQSNAASRTSAQHGGDEQRQSTASVAKIVAPMQTVAERPLASGPPGSLLGSLDGFIVAQLARSLKTRTLPEQASTTPRSQPPVVPQHEADHPAQDSAKTGQTVLADDPTETETRPLQHRTGESQPGLRLPEEQQLAQLRQAMSMRETVPPAYVAYLPAPDAEDGDTPHRGRWPSDSDGQQGQDEANREPDDHHSGQKDQEPQDAPTDTKDNLDDRDTTEAGTAHALYSRWGGWN